VLLALERLANGPCALGIRAHRRVACDMGYVYACGRSRLGRRKGTVAALCDCVMDRAREVWCLVAGGWCGGVLEVPGFGTAVGDWMGCYIDARAPWHSFQRPDLFNSFAYALMDSPCSVCPWPPAPGPGLMTQ